MLADPKSFPWRELDDIEQFDTPLWRERITKDLTEYLRRGTGPDRDRKRLVIDLLGEHAPKALARLKRLEDELRAEFVSKDEIIRMIIISALAQQPMLLIGEPGTAKSKIITRFCEGLGLSRAGETAENTYFTYLLHGFTEPDEVLGPVLISKLQADHPTFARHRAGSVTEAVVVFLDEVFKANSAILNALLTIINERYVYEGGAREPSRARLIYGASNGIPTPSQLQELRAFYERFIVRIESTCIQPEFPGENPAESRVQLLERGWRAEVGDVRSDRDPIVGAMPQFASLNDILLCTRALTEFWGGEELGGNEELGQENLQPFLRHYHCLTTDLSRGEEAPCRIDDRKFIRLFLLVRAHALYDHTGPPELSDLRVLAHTWDHPDLKEKARSLVEGYISGRSHL